MIIYQPKGRAREYSPLAANFYQGCDHGCIYCYVPRIFRMDRQKFRESVTPKESIISRLKDEIKKWKDPKEQVLLCFTGDPYCRTEMKQSITLSALPILLQAGFPVAILTKGGSRCLRDLDIFKQYKDQIKVGATLTFIEEKDTKEFEPYSARPWERMETLARLHQNGIRTWASFEPVIHPDQTIELLNQTLEYVDEYKIGKINQFQNLDKGIDWNAFLRKVVKILRDQDKDFYVKQDLREQAKDVWLSQKEKDMNALTLVAPLQQIRQLSLE